MLEFPRSGGFRLGGGEEASGVEGVDGGVEEEGVEVRDLKEHLGEYSGYQIYIPSICIPSLGLVRALWVFLPHIHIFIYLYQM